MPVRNRIAEMQPEIAAWRHDFHRHPELSYDVQRTAGIVAAKLREFGCDEVVEGIGRTGVVGVIRGQKSESGRTLGLRADMDALPIEEQTGADYASTVPGLMHACGHDGHTSMLLGAAKYLCETRNFDGTALVMFQPAEEFGAGGEAMVKDGVLDRWSVDEVYGLHNMPGLPVGQFAIRPGPLMASGDEFTITITGRGGHAAMPHQAVDTVLAASHVVTALQSVVSRNVNPVRHGVLTVTTFMTETDTFNVIPETAVLRGTVRTFDADMRDLAEARIAEVAEATARAFGASAEVTYVRGYPPTVNAEEQAAFAADCAEAVSPGVIRNTDPIMPAEDFSYFLNERPGAYIFLGNGDTPMCHHPAYDFDDEAIPAGCSWFAELVERRLPL